VLNEVTIERVVSPENMSVAWLNKGGKSGESDSPIKAGLRARGSQGMW